MKKHFYLFFALLAFGQTAWAQGLSGSGTEADPYLITSTADWNTFASNVNRDNDYLNKFLKLTADITVTEMAGTSSSKFHGTFDGNGYTLTFNKGTAENPFSEEYCAPFRYIFGATIKNLHVAGTIYTSNKFAGVVGSLDAGYDVNLSYITACRSSLTINSSASGDGTHGGFAGLIPQYNSNIHFTDCLFDGQLLGSETHSCGGFVGWHTGGKVDFTNCLFAPASVTFGTDNSCTFIRLNGNYSTPNFDHCYYKQAFGTAQGTNASDMDNTSLLSNLGTTWEIINGKVVPVMPRRPLTGNGTEQSPYQIASATDWDNLVYNVNTYGETYEGKYFKLMADISVTEMVGGGDGSSNVFKGTFDGDGHTITFNVASATEQYIAPFRRIDGATIKGVKMAGTVSSSNRFAGGIVAYAKGTSTITNCVNSTSISTVDYPLNYDSPSNGGIVGMVGGRGTINISGCVFNGQMHGTQNDNWCGILGLCNSNCTTTITDCLVDPVSSVAHGNTFHRSTGTTNLSNCYYTKTIGTAQGKQARTISAGEYVTVENAGTPSSNTTVGVIGYGTGIKYNDVLYAGNEDAVSLNLSCTLPAGYVFNQYTASAGDLTGTSNPYTLTMSDADVTITAALEVQPWGGQGNEGSPYIINYPSQLDLLATNVNNGNSYNNTYFKLGNNITYTKTGAANENNFTPIGNYNHSFNGHFDGDDHTISGIRIFSDGDSQDIDSYKALFGKIGSSAVVENITLTDADITGSQEVGGIVGYNKGTVTYCTVTNTVYIRCIQNYSNYHGGIVGYNYADNNNHATVSHCTSSATLTTVGNSTHHGAIVGTNFGLISDNLAIGATVSSTGTDAGAISGNNETSGGNNGTLVRNYYVNCTVAGTPNATNVGCGKDNSSASDLNNANNPDGAVPGNVRYVEGYGDNTQDLSKWVFIASPVSGSIAPTAVDNIFPAAVASSTDYDLYRFDQSADKEWVNYHAHTDDFMLENGQGYLYANMNDVTLTFTGTTYNPGIEPVEVLLTYDASKPFAGWNLVGNPFPRAAYVDRSYYLINAEGTAVEPQAVSQGTVIRPCTGVMVKAEDTDEVVTFSTTPSSQQNANNNGNLEIAVAQASNTRGSGTLDKAIVSFNEGDQLGKFYFGEQSANIYLPQEGEEYAIVSIGRDVARYVSTEIPVNFKANENGQYTITVNPEGVEMDYLHLIDNLTGNDIDLLALRQAQGPASYTFNAKTTDYESRFRLVFVAKGEAGPSTGSGAFAFMSDGNWIIANEGEATLQVIDLNGRILSSENINGSVSKAIHAVPGVYVIRLINGENVKVQKIVVR